MISLIAAIDLNYGIGFKNKLLWHIPKDLQRFKKLTLGKTILMGHATFKSIGKALPNRENLVLSTDKSLLLPNAVVHNNYKSIADRYLKTEEELMVIGGENLYALFLPLAHKLYISFIQSSANADRFFPKFDHSSWTEEFIEYVDSRPPHIFKVLKRAN